MRNLTLFIALSISSLGFAGQLKQSIMVPLGKQIVLTCRSNQPGKAFILNVLNSPSSNPMISNLEMELRAGGQVPIVYKNVRETMSTRMGAPTIYEAKAMGGHVSLVVNFTNTPHKNGRRGVLTSSAYGHSTTNEMLCNLVAY